PVGDAESRVAVVRLAHEVHPPVIRLHGAQHLPRDDRVHAVILLDPRSSALVATLNQSVGVATLHPCVRRCRPSERAAPRTHACSAGSRRRCSGTCAPTPGRSTRRTSVPWPRSPPTA